jgi:hypothetical protein
MSEHDVINDLRPANSTEYAADGYQTTEINIKGGELKVAMVLYSAQMNAAANARGVGFACKAAIMTLQAVAINLRQFVPKAQIDAILDDVKKQVASFEPFAVKGDELRRAEDAAETAAATKH